MTSGTVPRQGRYTAVEEMDQESLIYRRPSRTAIYLNETATLVWKLCDGARSVEDIIALLSESYPEQAAEIRADVTETVRQLVESGALVLASPEADAKPSVTTIEEE
jgi:hypothetical protein